MKIILFSRTHLIIEHWITKLEHCDSSKFTDIINCSGFKELGIAIGDPDHILLYHLAEGELEEKICYKFITKYQQQQKMLVFVNNPDPSQGLRIFRAGVHGYCNTYLGTKKLHVAIEVIAQGKIWVGGEILKHMSKKCGLNCSNSDSIGKDTKTSASATQQLLEAVQSKSNLVATLLSGFKKLWN